jgi:putative peptidoglycan lipid II flippase
VLAPGFFARQDTRTPVKIAIVCLILNIVVALILIWPLAHVGIALATSVSNWVNAALLGTLLHRRGFLEVGERLRRRLPRMVLATVLMGVSLWLAAAWTSAWPQLVAVVVLVVGGGVAFFGLAQVTGGVDLREVRALLRPGRT